MNTLKETNVKYTTGINSKGDRTVNIKSDNGANVTNVYDRHTNEFKYCYDHNKQCVKSYKHNGELYERIDYPKYDNSFNNGYSRYNNNFSEGYNNGYSKYNNNYSKYNNNFSKGFNNSYSKYNNNFDNGYSKRNKGYW